MERIDALNLQLIKEIKDYYVANLANNYQAANMHFNNADKVICKIMEIPGWINGFLPLLDDENPGVRLRAASILLPYETKRAEAALRKLCFTSGLIGFSAKMVLNEWRSGKLKSPAFENGTVVYK